MTIRCSAVPSTVGGTLSIEHVPSSEIGVSPKMAEHPSEGTTGSLSSQEEKEEGGGGEDFCYYSDN